MIRKKVPVWVLMIMLASLSALAQKQAPPTINRFADLAFTAGNSQGSAAASYVYNWRLGKKRKFEAGLGLRWTSYFGSKKDFITAAPATLTRSFTFPFLIVFAGQKEKNFDTLTVQRPLTQSLNLTANLGYQIGTRWYAGFNIDLIGFTFGRKDGSLFQGVDATNGEGTYIDPSSKPAAFNLLLTGDHDLGSLNSEFFLKYNVGGKWSLRAIYQFIFVEYKTDRIKQQFSDGTTNSRFRNKANNLGLGVSYQL